LLFKTNNPNPEWLELFSTLATQTAIAIENYELFDRMQKSSLNLSVAYDATIESLTKAVEMRGYETGEKLRQIAQMTVSLAYEMGFKNESIGDIMRGAYLHDIGNVKIPEAILYKKGKLTKEEWIIVREHPQNAVDMLSTIKYLKPALEIPYCHHEKWNGSGYPRGLKGEEIPLSARVFSIVDVWNALISDRPFRKAWSKNKAKDYILSQSGSHFDPQIVKVFFEKFLS
jgi:response regulator RpfG family c-di-GMP phosphodiesterase